jgi:hypothetical protein
VRLHVRVRMRWRVGHWRSIAMPVLVEIRVRIGTRGRISGRRRTHSRAPITYRTTLPFRHDGHLIRQGPVIPTLAFKSIEVHSSARFNYIMMLAYCGVACPASAFARDDEARACRGPLQAASDFDSVPGPGPRCSPMPFQRRPRSPIRPELGMIAVSGAADKGHRGLRLRIKAGGRQAACSTVKFRVARGAWGTATHAHID